MRTSDKLLLIMIAIINYAVAALIILSRFLGVYRPFDGIISFSLSNKTWETTVLIFAIILTVIVGTSLFIIVSRASKYRLVDRNDTIALAGDENGTAAITFDALRAIAVKKCKSFRYVSECNCDVWVRRDELHLDMRLRPMQDTKLTDATQEIRSAVTEAVREQTGLSVSDIRILILPYKIKKN